MSEQASEQKAKRMLGIFAELLNLTRKMAKSTDPDFLIEAIDKRGDLMTEYDTLRASSARAAAVAGSTNPQVAEMINEIIELDKKINKTLFSLYHDAKVNLKTSNQNAKILQYTNQAISSTGSYIDLKE